MASIKSKAFIVFLRLIRKKSFLKMQFDFGKFDFYQCPKPPKKIYDTCLVEQTFIQGRPVFTLHPKHSRSVKHILYLHGGAYVQNFVRQHWTFMAFLVQNLQCSITTPDYPLAPGFTYKDAFQMVIPLYKELLDRVPAHNLILMGDSAGGGFALALSQQLQQEKVTQPGQLFLLSPWLDISLTNPAIQAIDPLDPFLGIEGLQKAGISYAGDTDVHNPMVSPINGSLAGLPSMYLFIGSRDILAADARKLMVLMQKEKSTIHYYEYAEMVHVWMLMNFPESRKARDQIISLIKQ
ncbi:alpha/beta hydrolase [Xanthocytophaga flava]|uniref:alpha/beta hydrolase n=1 Tax=Xanthocytophaga flava TaxID=3048013 RepID=UPI0028D82578|nr:alpha/beta hydrolase [Xanthocytophaga flavus]MDJ1469524.1 alpha/beta hydrolase [Xanthocytophaga flavus]